MEGYHDNPKSPANEKNVGAKSVCEVTLCSLSGYLDRVLLADY